MGKKLSSETIFALLPVAKELAGMMSSKSGRI